MDKLRHADTKIGENGLMALLDLAQELRLDDDGEESTTPLQFLQLGFISEKGNESVNNPLDELQND
jgi:hypothetical protein